MNISLAGSNLFSTGVFSRTSRLAPGACPVLIVELSGLSAQNPFTNGSLRIASIRSRCHVDQILTRYDKSGYDR